MNPLGSSKQEYPPLFDSGFHDFDIARLRQQCVGDFPLSTGRATLMDGLERLIDELNGVGLRCEAWVDGSFLTKKIDPDDIDVVFIFENQQVSAPTPDQERTLLRIANYRDEIKRKYGCDAYLGVDGITVGATKLEPRVYWEKQFGLSRGKQVKGIAKLKLGTP